MESELHSEMTGRSRARTPLKPETRNLRPDHFTVPTVDPTEDLIRILRQRRLRGQRYVWLSPENRATLFAKAGSDARRTPTNQVPAAERQQAEPAPPSTPKPSPERRPFLPESTPLPQPALPPKPAMTAAESAPVNELDLAGLGTAVAACRKCELHRNRTKAVFGEGHPRARLMFIGEGPGSEEDQTGRPFVGAAGQLLDRMIAAMQFRREEVYIANVVKCRPPQNRVPAPAESQACLPYLERQIELIQPEVIVLLGNTPLQHLLGMDGITRVRGTWQHYRNISVMPTFHPAFLLRYEPRKKDVWADLQEVMRRLGKDPKHTVPAASGTPQP